MKLKLNENLTATLNKSNNILLPTIIIQILNQLYRILSLKLR